MKQKSMEYLTPEVKEQDLLVEGVICLSDSGFESYGGDPGEDDSIF